MRDIAAHAPEFREKAVTLESLFKPSTQCFMLANPHYGHQAEVRGGEERGGGGVGGGRERGGGRGWEGRR